MTKNKKITIGVIVAVIIAIIIGGGFYATDNKTAVGNKVVLALMPKSISGVTADGNMTFYVEENKDYDAKEDSSSPMNGFTFYYNDSDGKRVDIPSSGYYTDSAGTKHSVMLGFTEKALENLAPLRTAVKVFTGVVIAAVIVLAIFLWYKSWCKREEKIKEELYSK